MPDEVEQELLRHVGALRELPDGVDPHHVLARPPRPPRPFNAGTKKMSSATGSLLSCAVRYAEMELRM